jgi:hypothetical protein
MAMSLICEEGVDAGEDGLYHVIEVVDDHCGDMGFTNGVQRREPVGAFEDVRMRLVVDDSDERLDVAVVFDGGG